MEAGRGKGRLGANKSQRSADAVAKADAIDTTGASTPSSHSSEDSLINFEKSKEGEKTVANALASPKCEGLHNNSVAFFPSTTADLQLHSSNKRLKTN